ncbi:MAG: sugar phosphate isomerase/epimerase [Verrucomicrobiales bacterium]|nr:sugar phosphate isomerase/epimerase [Verrucomicrobiales bacterium]
MNVTLDNRLTIRLEVLPGKTVVDRVKLAADCGFDGIAFPGRMKDRFGEETLANLDRLELPVQTVSLGFTGSLCSPDESIRKACHESLGELFRFAGNLGAISVNMPPVLIEDNPGRFPESEAVRMDQLLVERLPELGDEAEKRNLDLLIEPVNRFETEYLKTVGHAARICEAVNHPRIGMTPDFFHMQMEELDTSEAMSGAMPWIRHVHTAENTRVEPGPGQLDFRPGFRVLRNGGYSGLIEVECRSLSGKAEDVLPLCSRYLRKEWEACV